MWYDKILINTYCSNLVLASYVYDWFHKVIRLSLFLYKNVWYGMQKQPSCKNEAQPSKVESYLKDEWMHGMANNKSGCLNVASA